MPVRGEWEKGRGKLLASQVIDILTTASHDHHRDHRRERPDTGNTRRVFHGSDSRLAHRDSTVADVPDTDHRKRLRLSK